jgi:5-formyltetrahydrofolate cyclo-ligase
MSAIPFRGDDAVSLYAPKGDEADCLPLAPLLVARRCQLCLPVILDGKDVLAFRLWNPGDPLAPGRFEILEPRAENPLVKPDIVVLPLLAFDRCGHRLGYGGGYYDRTLAALRRQGKVTAVGYGFSVQEVAQLPVDGQDELLNWIVTEKEARAFTAGDDGSDR